VWVVPTFSPVAIFTMRLQLYIHAMYALTKSGLSGTQLPAALPVARKAAVPAPMQSMGGPLTCYSGHR
jgi:hypothetical protein